jgi:hypothetical protein
MNEDSVTKLKKVLLEEAIEMAKNTEDQEVTYMHTLSQKEFETNDIRVRAMLDKAEDSRERKDRVLRGKLICIIRPKGMPKDFLALIIKEKQSLIDGDTSILNMTVWEEKIYEKYTKGLDEGFWGIMRQNYMTDICKTMNPKNPADFFVGMESFINSENQEVDIFWQAQTEENKERTEDIVEKVKDLNGLFRKLFGHEE